MSEELLQIPSVSELTSEIKTLLESNFFDVVVQGEVSQPKKSSNGHIYFTLKDDKAQLPCVIWRSLAEAQNIELVHGQHIIVGGNVEVYAPHGRYQLIVSIVKQAGEGALQKAFEELKRKLMAEGLFDEAHKRKLPAFPKIIGVITSATSAAFQDIRSTLEKRFPLVTVRLYHASVQGINAASEIVRGINYFSKKTAADLLIVGRGGGSLEDLWPFNEEAVARAIYNCSIPVISAVGHETDFSISDFVADVRAATPTQAASIAVPDINELRFYSEDLDNRLRNNINFIVTRRKETVDRLIHAHGLMVVRQKVLHKQEILNNFQYRMENSTRYRFLNLKEQAHNLIQRMQVQNPNLPMEKGYVRIIQKNKWIRESSKFIEKEEFSIQWKDHKNTIKPAEPS